MDAGIPGDIWSTGAFSFESPLKDLLDSGSYTVEQLLAEDELLQEIRGLHPQLLDFFSTEESVMHLVQHVVRSPSEFMIPELSPHEFFRMRHMERELFYEMEGMSEEERNGTKKKRRGKNRFRRGKGDWLYPMDLPPPPQRRMPKEERDLLYVRYPYVACEVICCEISAIIDVLVDGRVVAKPDEHGAEAETNEEPIVETNVETNEEPSEEAEPKEEPTEETEEETKDEPKEETEDENPNEEAKEETEEETKDENPNEEAKEETEEEMVNKDTELETNEDTKDEANEAVKEETNKDTTEETNGETTGEAKSESNVEINEEMVDEAKTNDSAPVLILDVLFAVLYDTEPGELDDYRAGYFDKILAVLCRKRPQAMSAYINDGGGKGAMVLMGAMLKHLYSHSILQVVQRLLLPQPVSAPVESEEENDGPWRMGKGDPMNQDSLPFRCTWSESAESLDLLLNRLIGHDTHPDLDEEQRLAEAQNASEVLITIIQNSPLRSPSLVALTKDPILERIIEAARHVPQEEDFTSHDGTVTCAMNVLESLVLQLGGYGSVGPGGEGDEGAPLDDPTMEEATTDGLLQHLPSLLTSLCTFLRHPTAESWSSPMQFAPSEKQSILGTSRLRIIRLIESLVLLGHPDVDKVLCDSNCLEICLDLFWEFEWNSMLHQSVANLLVHVFEGANARADLQAYLLNGCQLIRRLVESFEEPGDQEGTGEKKDDGEELPMLSDAVLGAKTDVPAPESVGNSSNNAEFGDSEDEVLPVSDDDVDAAIEQQENAAKNDVPAEEVSATDEGATFGLDDGEAKEPSPSTDLPSQIPPLRKGYMGHVIIICQALVHASTPPEEEQGQEVKESSSDFNENEFWGHKPADEVNGVHSPKGDLDASEAVANGDIEPPQQTNEADAPREGTTLIIATLIQDHPLQARWQEFVTTTLAAETAIQSTPLGGYQTAQVTIDPLHSHRPSLNDMGDFQDANYGDDDDDDDDDTGGEKSLTLGSEVLALDDNDIEIAASMMDALSLPQQNATAVPGNEVGGSSGASFDTNFDNARPSGGNEYIFDDPLGKRNNFDRFGEDDDDSSDEEEQTPRRDSNGPPVMDLFAGNFGFDGENNQSSNQAVAVPAPSGEEGWSNFANFDDAFASGGDPFADQPPVEPPSDEKPPDVVPEPSLRVDLFEESPHDFLLDDPAADGGDNAPEQKETDLVAAAAEVDVPPKEDVTKAIEDGEGAEANDS